MRVIILLLVQGSVRIRVRVGVRFNINICHRAIVAGAIIIHLPSYSKVAIIATLYEMGPKVFNMTMARSRQVIVY